MSRAPSLALRYWPTWAQWFALIILAGSAGQLLNHLQLPAGQFVGPMLVAIGFGVCGTTLRIHRQAFRLCQGTIGLLVAHSISMAVLTAVVQSWPVMLFATALTVLLSTAVGLVMARYGGIGARTAAWGTSPGAASAMVSMAEDNGADGRIVATMQYVRVVCVVMIGALVSRLLGADGSGTQAHGAVVSLQGAPLLDLALSLAVIVIGVLLGTRLPAGALLGPLLLGGVLQLCGLIHIVLPAPVLSLAYATVGCYVGLRFDRTTIRCVFKRLPAMISGSLLLIVLCALSAWLVADLLGKDFLSVYLATSPGGLDSMAIIAVDTHSDVGLVLAMQTLRLFGVIVTGAWLARWVIRLSER